MLRVMRWIPVVVLIVGFPVGILESQSLPMPGSIGGELRCDVLEPGGGVMRLPSRVRSATIAPCDGVCVVDVAFSYFSETLRDGRRASGLPSADAAPSTESELREWIGEAFKVVNRIYKASNTGLLFRLVAVEPMGDHHQRPSGHFDLWYAVDPAGVSNPGASLVAAAWAWPPSLGFGGQPVWWNALDGGIAGIGDPGVLPHWTVSGAPIQTWQTGQLLAHEFGHSLGLQHGPDSQFPGVSEWEGGNGFKAPWGVNERQWYSTVMSSGGVRCADPYYEDGSECWAATGRLDRFSSATDRIYPGDDGIGEFDFIQSPDDPRKRVEIPPEGWRLGNAKADAVTVLRENAAFLVARGPRHPNAPPPPEYEDEDTDPPNDPMNDPPDHSQTVAWLNGERHSVQVEFDEDGDGSVYSDARVVDANLPGDKSAVLYFFDPTNAEMLVKVLDGCNHNGHWWVYAASATDLGFRLTVTDTRSNASKVYFNENMNAARAITDNSAFACSP